MRPSSGSMIRGYSASLSHPFHPRDPSLHERVCGRRSHDAVGSSRRCSSRYGRSCRHDNVLARRSEAVGLLECLEHGSRRSIGVTAAASRSAACATHRYARSRPRLSGSRRGPQIVHGTVNAPAARRRLRWSPHAARIRAILPASDIGWDDWGRSRAERCRSSPRRCW